jgi:hypothetical protein
MLNKIKISYCSFKERNYHSLLLFMFGLMTFERKKLKHEVNLKDVYYEWNHFTS